MVQKLEEAMTNIQRAFEHCPEILQVMFTIGATTVTPKEVYLINMPPLNPDAENLSGKDSVKTLFRQLIMQDPLCNLKKISTSSTAVLLYGPRKSCINWFLPRPMFKTPVRGSKVEFQLCNTVGQGNHDLSKDFTVAELSGFEPFDISMGDTSSSPMASHRICGHSQSSEDSISADYVCIDSAISMDMYENDGSDDESEPNMSNIDTLLGSQSLKHLLLDSNLNSNNSKQMKKSASTSSILSQTSVILKSVSSVEDMDIGVTQLQDFHKIDSENIWYQSPISIKGYKISNDSLVQNS
ncbi:hypothetical protein DPMN_102236 [Dreissena polymorpha]|uniref:MAD2L1-binding protein n=2 Tax=Dreissena polymorpha TaxID=45954 RepID=A0A9D4LL22_DREPO|nr:hypothetical protein DPMN_102236 [Dreissena polymorpha]